MYITDDLKNEIDFFKRTNEHFVIEAGEATAKVAEATDEMLYMAFAASTVMDYSEDIFFENFVITDKNISGRNEMLIDAYALIESDRSKTKQLHIFQYKLYSNANKSASPVEVMNFATFVNNNFLHPEFADEEDTNEVVAEIKSRCQEFIDKRRGNSIQIFCHYINNTTGISKSNEKEITYAINRFEVDKQIFGFSVQVYGSNEIYELATEGKIKVGEESIDILNDNQTYSYRIEDNSKKDSIGLPKKVLIGMCNVNEFIRLQNKYHHNQLYSENIRLYLGDRGSVNKDIISTITSDESIWFPYMNNGISIICDSMTMGSPNAKNNSIGITLENMQIINGCQTVNALYSAKYNASTKDNFRPSNIMVRIYEINPSQTDFKMNIIRATNNQNSVKSYSLMSNDPIQIKIGEVLKDFDIVYDRKGEGKSAKKDQIIINMANVALAYRAVYLFKARSLRSGLGKSRVFQKSEYEQVFSDEFLESERKPDFLNRCLQLIISNEILNAVREQIQQNTVLYLDRLPIFKKSAYYFAGYLYAFNKKAIDSLQNEMFDAYSGANFQKIRGKNFPDQINKIIIDSFSGAMESFIQFYNGVDLDKTDIDNLLKDKDFENLYLERIATL